MRCRTQGRPGPGARTSWHRHDGSSLVELLMTLMLASTLTAMAIAPIGSAMQRYTMTTASQTVAAEVRAARLKAVAKNRTMRVRFDCPGPGQFRVVEVVGNAAIDDDPNRCSEATYPYPDPNPAVAPNADGPVMWLNRGATFERVQDLQISPRGRAQPLEACPACTLAPSPATIGLTNGHDNQTITISVSGVVASHAYEATE